MGEQESVLAIIKTARDLLKECYFYEPPVNLDILYESVKLKRYGHFFDEGSTWSDYKLPRRIRAILDVRDQIVIVNYNAHEKQQTFASVHEVGHFVLPWQKELLYFCSQWDLDSKTRKLFEREANLFAAETLFLGDQFTQEAKCMQFGIAAIIYLADRYNVSLESAGWRYIEKSKLPCALLACNPIKSSNLLEPPSTELHYYHKSESFPLDFVKGQQFPPHHVISKTCSNMGDIDSGKLHVGKIELGYESLYTTYKVLTIVGDKKLFTGKYI